MQQLIRIRGAREHNLKNIDVDLPRDSLVVITGLSGSGKSSLAFDTVYAEGQRRYVESLSAYARQFLELMQKPEVESIEGLSPAISIEQKTTSRNPRSTVATVTEIYDYMRLLWARVGVPYSPATGLPIVSQTVSQMVDRVMAMPEGTRLYLLAPIARGRKGEYRKEFIDLRKRGFQRVKIDGKMVELDEVRPLNKNLKHDIAVVVDRIIVSSDLGNRLANSFETALDLADGIAIAENADSGEETIFSAKFACPVSGFTIPEIEPRLFSFNNPFGACPACDGLGTKLYFDPALVVHDEGRSLAEGAVSPWSHSSSPYYTQTLESIAKHFRQSMHTPWRDLPEKMRHTILSGSAGEPIAMTYDDGLRIYTTDRAFEGVLPNMERRFRETDSAWVREELGRYQSAKTCEVCHGDRLKPEALAVKIGGNNISEVARLSIADALTWFSGIDAELTRASARSPSASCARSTSGSAFCRCRARIFDPVAGLGDVVGRREPAHPARLADRLRADRRALCARRAIDRLAPARQGRLLTTLGGCAISATRSSSSSTTKRRFAPPIGLSIWGRGRASMAAVVAEGTPDDDHGQLGGPDRPVPDRHAADRGAGGGDGHPGKFCALSELREQSEKHHRRDPLGTFLLRVRRLGRRQIDPDHRDPVQGAGQAAQQRARAAGPRTKARRLECLDKVIVIDQSPIGRTPRSNPATYTGCFTPIRDFRGAARGEVARLRTWPVLVQCQGRTLRRLRG